MEYQNLLIENRDGIVLLIINREKALNALNRLTFDELERFFTTDYQQIPGLKGVVITGAGSKSFVAGADITELLNLGGEGEHLSKRGQDIFFLIERFHLPVIAAVNGFALGGGCELAMACHFRIASENALFGQPEVNLGVIPGYGGTQRLAQLVGKGRALELMMTADRIDAAQALAYGLVNRVVAQETLIDKAVEILTKIAEKAPFAIEKIIESVNALYDDSKNGYETEYMAFAQCAQTDDFKEGVQAFIEKRKARFAGK